jgi:hypothetical protein
MKKLIIAINPHKKSGKSTFVRVYSEMLTRNGLDFTNLHTSDNDAHSGSLLWDVEEDPDQELLLVNMENNDVVILDVASEHTDYLTDYLESSDTYEALAELDAEVTVVIPINADADMSSQIVSLGEFFADEAAYVVACSPAVNKDRWTGSAAHKYMCYLGAIEIEMPVLNKEFSSQCENEYHLSLPTALSRRKELPRFLRDELHNWELAYASNLGEADELLVPGEKVSKSAYGSRYAETLND